MKQLTVAQIDGHMRNPLIVDVHPLIGRWGGAAILHKEDQIASLQASDIVNRGAVVTDPLALFAGIRGKNDAERLTESLTYEIRAVEGRCCAAVRPVLIRRAKILLPRLDHRFDFIPEGRGFRGWSRRWCCRSGFRNGTADF
ncbi:hypothetical protein D1872_246650 [compost metagenome]